MPQTAPLTAAQVRDLGAQLAQLLTDAGAGADTSTLQEALPAFLRKAGVALVDHNHARLPFGKLVPEGQCPRCDERRAEKAEGIAARPAPAWAASAQRRQNNNGGYPTSEELADHKRPGGPHATGACNPVCTFGDW